MYNLRSFLRSCLAVLLGLFFFASCADDVHQSTSEPKSDLYITSDEAIEIAKKFVENNGEQSTVTRAAAGGQFKVVYTDLPGQTRASATQHPSYYVVNLDSTSFVVVSGSKVTTPVLGFSFNTAFTPQAIPDGVGFMLGDLANQVKYYNKTLKPTSATEQMREKDLQPIAVTRASGGAQIEPILGGIHWNQQPYYNTYCPRNCPVGCVATATAQIMRHYKYPKSGQGKHGYNSYYGYLSFDYNYQINWDNMPEGRLTYYNDDVAKFCYGVAVALDMGFSPNGSGTWQYYVPNVLKKYYKYPSNVTNANRDNYTAAQWEALVLRELRAGRPVQYCGGGTGGAHSFVCDGYWGSSYFHFNWGWGGMSDNYFRLNALNPGSLGTGGGTGGGFNWNQSIVINFAPPGGVTPEPTPDPAPTPAPGGYEKAWGESGHTTYIKNISLGSQSRTSGSSSQGYTYNGTNPFKVYAGEKYLLSLTPGFTNGIYAEYWTAYIDYNCNRKFDDGELVAYGRTTSTSPYQQYITIPTTACTNKSRLRICMSWESYAAATGKFGYGEVEDYDIYVVEKQNPTPTPTPQPTPNPNPKPTPNPTPTPTPTDYCKSGSVYPQEAYIRSVQLGSMVNLTGASPYTNYYNRKVASGYAGYSFRYTLSGVDNSCEDLYWRIWIDANNDKEFDNSELVFEKVDKMSIYGYFKLPSNLTRRKYYRVRVSMKKGGYADPCERFNYGEVEDYSLYIY